MQFEFNAEVSARLLSQHHRHNLADSLGAAHRQLQSERSAFVLTSREGDGVGFLLKNLCLWEDRKWKRSFHRISAKK